jgi:hypothetical protein
MSANNSTIIYFKRNKKTSSKFIPILMHEIIYLEIQVNCNNKVVVTYSCLRFIGNKKAFECIHSLIFIMAKKHEKLNMK